MSAAGDAGDAAGPVIIHNVTTITNVNTGYNFEPGPRSGEERFGLPAVEN